MHRQQGFIAWLLAAILFVTASVLGWFYYRSADDNQLHRQSISKLTSEQRALQQQLDQAKQQAEQQASRAEQERRTLQQQRQQLETTVTELTEQLSIAQTTDQNQISQLAAAVEQQRTLQIQMNELQTALKSAQTQLASATHEREQARSTIQGLQDQLQQASSVEQRYQAARQQLALEQAENESFSDTIARLQAEMAAESKAMAALENQLQAQLSELNQKNEKLVTQLEDGTTAIKLPESILFASGSATINKAGHTALISLAKALTAFPNHLISVQGHSDQQRISNNTALVYPTNWELSSARASAAVRTLITAGIPAQQLQAVGFADTRPLVSEVDEKTRQTNRRIEVILLPNQFRLKVLPNPAAAG